MSGHRLGGPYGLVRAQFIEEGWVVYLPTLDKYTMITGKTESLTCKWNEERDECSKGCMLGIKNWEGCKLDDNGWGHFVAVVKKELENGNTKISFVQTSSVKSNKQVPPGRGIWKELVWHADGCTRISSLFHILRVYHLEFALTSPDVFEVGIRKDHTRYHTAANCFAMSNDSLAVLKLWVDREPILTDASHQSNSFCQEHEVYTSINWHERPSNGSTRNDNDLTTPRSGTSASTVNVQTPAQITPPAMILPPPTTPSLGAAKNARDDSQGTEPRSSNPVANTVPQSRILGPSYPFSMMPSRRAHARTATTVPPPTIPKSAPISTTDTNRVAAIPSVVSPTAMEIIPSNAGQPRLPQTSLPLADRPIIPGTSSTSSISTRDTSDSASAKVSYDGIKGKMRVEPSHASELDQEAVNGRPLPEILTGNI
ncbi:hypothetical protein DL95DRAFT_409915 [Leptodontidium sp. 2 PMI_412]|nr:hypothetical protein DL95DRAFT_409915 [Leptodontidium sp. 2 PMI_412]